MAFFIERAPSGQTSCQVCGRGIRRGDARLVAGELRYHVGCAVDDRPEAARRALDDVRDGIELDRGDLAPRREAALARDADRRAAAVRDHAAAEIAPGEAEPTADRLLAHLADHPGDAAALAVLGDLLSQRGDPRGELIALQLADHDGLRATELLAALAVPGDATTAPPRAVWGVGFIRRLEIGSASAPTAIWRHPSLQLLGELAIEFRAAMPPASIDYLARELPRSLRRLELVNAKRPTIARDLAVALPRLDELIVRSRADVRGLAHPRLRRLELDAAGAPDDLATIAERLSPRDLPALDELAIAAFANFDDVCAVLARAGWLPRLRRLALRRGRFTDRGIVALARGLGDHRLERLDLAGTHVPPDMLGPLSAACGELIDFDGNARAGAASWIEHAEHPEWGRGRVVARHEGKLEIAFERAGTKVFAATARVLVSKP